MLAPTGHDGEVPLQSGGTGEFFLISSFRRFSLFLLMSFSSLTRLRSTETRSLRGLQKPQRSSFHTTPFYGNLEAVLKNVQAADFPHDYVLRKRFRQKDRKDTHLCLSTRLRSTETRDRRRKRRFNFYLFPHDYVLRKLGRRRR